MPNSQVVVRPLVAILVIAALGALAQPAGADITSLSGAISEQTPHPTGNLDSNTLQSDTTAYVWFEQKVTLSAPLTLDHVGIGTVNSTGSANSQQVTPGFALSYIVHFDQDNAVGTGGVTLSEIEIKSDGRTLRIIQTRSSGNGVDQMRILVNPEPGTAALVGLGLAGLTGLVVRRGRRREGLTSRLLENPSKGVFAEERVAVGR